VSYEGQLQNFINYTIEYQYLEKHNNLPTESEIYSKIYVIHTPVAGKGLRSGNQAYDYYRQQLVLSNIENILLKHASGYIFLANYGWRALVNNETTNSKKNSANNLISSWNKILNGKIKNVQSLYKQAFSYYLSNNIISYVTHYSNVNYNNYNTKIGYLSNKGIKDILNMKSNTISKIYDYYNSSIPINLGGYVGYYYFVVSQSVGGRYINYNSMVTNLRSQSNIIIY
jgi:hypothetical protein